MRSGDDARNAAGGTAGGRTLVIIGAGGFGRELIDIVADVNAVCPTFGLLGFLDDAAVRTDLLGRLGVRWLGPTSDIPAGASHVIAIADPVTRRQIDEVASAAGSPAARLIHPASTVSRHATLGPGCVLAAGARVMTDVVLGRHVHVNMNSAIGHDSELADFVTLFSGVQVGGGVVIGPGATLGAGSTILPGIRIGAGAYVGAGATVVRDVEPGATVVTPAARPTLGAPRGGPDNA